MDPENIENNENNTTSNDVDTSFWDGEQSQNNENETDVKFRQQVESILSSSGDVSFNLMNDEVLNALGEKKFDVFNNTFSTQMQQFQKQTTSQTVAVMQAFIPAMVNRIMQAVEGKFNSRDTNGVLKENFSTQYNNPATQPVVQAVYNQALRKSNGDVSKATLLTRQILATLQNDDEQQPATKSNVNWNEYAGLVKR